MVDPDREAPGPPTPLIRGRAPASRWLVRVAQLLAVILILVLAWRLLEQIGWRHIWLRLRDAKVGWVTAAVAALMARFALLYHRWSLALAAAGFHPAWFRGLASQLAAVLVNHLTPTARLFGGVLRARFVSRQLARPFAQIYATVLVDQISHQAVLGLVTWLALIAVATWAGHEVLATGLSLFLALLLIVLVIWRSRARSDHARPIANLVGLAAEKRGKRLGPLFVSGREIIAILRSSFSDVPLQLRMALTGLFVFLLNVAAQSLVFESLGTPVSPVAIASGVALGLAAGWITGTPGGVATTEAAMVGLYVAMGVGSVEATAGVLLYRGIHYLLVLTLGLPSLLFCGGEKKRVEKSRYGPAEEAPPGSETPPAESPPDSVG
jgi:uncharacterized protein (TIRG00374 family)